MTTSRISYNIHGHNVRDQKRLLDHLQVLQPRAVMVLDNLDLAREIKRLLPNSTVIFREYERNEDVHKRYTPQQWLDSHAHQAAGGIILHVLNEPPFNREVIAWLTELLKLAAPRRIPLIIGNWATGNPSPEAWAEARELLQLLDQHRDLFWLGLHEYAGGVITSGLIGGYPDNAGVAPGKGGGQNLIHPSTWPRDVSTITRWHMGRFKFLLDYCKAVGIRPPRIILTEHGFDDTSDIKTWLDGLIRAFGVTTLWEKLIGWLKAARKWLIRRWNALVADTVFSALYVNIRGWKTLRNQWTAWFGGLGWTHERAYFEQLKWADQVIYQNSPVEAQCIFCWGYSSQDWEQFDVSEAGEFQRLLEEYARAGTTPQPPAPPPSPPTKPPVNEPPKEEGDTQPTDPRLPVLNDMQTHLSLAAQHLEAVVTLIERLK